jgi:hypothetical protein
MRYPLLWSILFMIMLLVEGIALGSPTKGDTLSEQVWFYIRDDSIGRFVILMVWTWLTYHWFLMAPNAPRHDLSWRDAVAAGVGFVWALLETVRIIKR